MRNTQKGDSWFWVIVIVALVAFGLWSLKTNPPLPNTDNSYGAHESTTTTTTTTTTNVAPPRAINYNEALERYARARIQLDNNCQATPSSLTLKDNSSIMIDNRSPVPRTVKVGATYVVPPYGFIIVNIVSPQVPEKWYVDCDSSQNVAVILVQL